MPQGLVERYSTPTARSEREEHMQKFLVKLNVGRKEAGYSQLTIGRLVKLFEGVPTEDLHPFYKRCEDARSFSAMFWHCLKPNKK